MNSTELPNTPDKGQAPTVPSIHIRFISICMALHHLLHPSHQIHSDDVWGRPASAMLHSPDSLTPLLLLIMVFLHSCLGCCWEVSYMTWLLCSWDGLSPSADTFDWQPAVELLSYTLPVKLKLATRVIILWSYFCSGGGILQAAKTQNLEWRRYGELVCCDTAALLSSCFDGCSLRA